MLFKSFILLLIVASATQTLAGPASQCNASSSDPCCYYSSFYNTAGTDYNLIRLAFLDGRPGYCPQVSFDRFTTALNNNKCWHGFIAYSTDLRPEYLNMKQFTCNAQAVSCVINYYVPMDYDCSDASQSQFDYKSTTIGLSVASGVMLIIILAAVLVYLYRGRLSYNTAKVATTTSTISL